jgi:PAS domain S-box-containing protein
MKKKVSLFQVGMGISIAVLAISSILIYYVFYNQQKEIEYKQVAYELNKDRVYIENHDLVYKILKKNKNIDNDLMNPKNILVDAFYKHSDLLKEDGILIKDIKNNKIIAIKGDQKELIKTPIKDKIQKITIDGNLYYVEHFLIKNYNFDIVLYYNMNKIDEVIASEIKSKFIVVIALIIALLFILNFLSKKILIEPTYNLMNMVKFIFRDKDLHQIEEEFPIKELDEMKIVFNQTIEEIKNNQVAMEKELEKIKYQKNFYVDIFDSLETLIVVTDGKEIKKVNQAFFDFFEEFKNLDEFKRTHSCVCDYFIREEGFVYPSDDNNWAEYLIAHPEEEHKVKMQKGDKIHIFKITANRLRRYHDIVVTLSDITELERAKVLLVELNNYLTQFIELINQSTIVSKTDVKGIITYANDEFCRISGYSREELIGQPHNIVRHPDTPKEVFKKMWETILAGKVYKSDLLKNRHKDGSAYYVRAVITPIKDKNGNIKQFVAVRQDVTKFVEAIQRAEEAEHSKMMFLSRMSNEIKPPLDGIVEFTTSLLKSNNIRGRERIYLELVDANAKGLLHTMDEVLDIAKLDSGNITFEEKEFNLLISLKQTAESLKEKAVEKNIDYKVNIDINPPVNVITDEEKINKVISTLLNNSIKFTPEHGKIELDVKKEKETDDKIRLCFYVKDNGIGIPKEQQEKLFETFTEDDDEIERKSGGAGLGLNVSYKIVEKMGSKLKIESDEEKGNVFYFCLELKKSNNKNDLMTALESVSVVLINCDKSEQIKNYLSKSIKHILELNELDAINNNDLIFTKDEKLLDKFNGYEEHFVIVGKDIPKDFNNAELLDSVINFITRSKTDSNNKISLRNKNKMIEEIDENSDIEYNKAEVAKLIGLPEFVFNKILETFFKNIQSDIDKLEEAINSGDFDVIAKAAHKIKGGTETIKFDKLANIANAIEENAKEKNNVEYSNMLMKLKKVLGKYREILE